MTEAVVGEVVYVTNLNDDGLGSFRVEATRHPAKEVHF